MKIPRLGRKRILLVGAAIVVVGAAAVYFYDTKKDSSPNEGEQTQIQRQDELENYLQTEGLTPDEIASAKLSIAQDLYAIEQDYKGAVRLAEEVMYDETYSIGNREPGAQLSAAIHAKELGDFASAAKNIDYILGVYRAQGTDAPAYLTEQSEAYSKGEIKIIGEDSLGE